MVSDHPALDVRAISMAFGGLKVFHDVSYRVAPREILGVIGPNGAGKTTMINIISGRLRPTAGEVFLGRQRLDGRSVFDNARSGLVRSFQQTAIFAGVSVAQNVQRAARFSGQGDGMLERLEPLLRDFGLIPLLHRSADELPYGMQKLLGLSLALAAAPKMLLLDEPAAGLEKSERSNIDRYIAFARDELGCGVLIVEHDMDLIRRLCPRTVVLDGGRLIAEGPPAEVLARKEVIAAYLGGPGNEEAV